MHGDEVRAVHQRVNEGCAWEEKNASGCLFRSGGPARRGNRRTSISDEIDNVAVLDEGVRVVHDARGASNVAQDEDADGPRICCPAPEEEVYGQRAAEPGRVGQRLDRDAHRCAVLLSTCQQYCCCIGWQRSVRPRRQMQARPSPTPLFFSPSLSKLTNRYLRHNQDPSPSRSSSSGHCPSLSSGHGC